MSNSHTHVEGETRETCRVCTPGDDYETRLRELTASLIEARDELAAANARCAELEELAEVGFKRAEFTEAESIQLQADAGSFRGLLHNAEADRDALQARLDRVTALADEWDDEDLLAYPPTMDNRIDVVDELRAALADSGTKDGSNDE